MSFTLTRDTKQHTFSLAGSASQVRIGNDLYPSFKDYWFSLYPYLELEDVVFSNQDNLHLDTPVTGDFAVDILPEVFEFDFEGQHYRTRVGQITDFID